MDRTDGLPLAPDELAHYQAHQAQQAMGPWLAGLASWDYYATLTYDPKRAANPERAPTEYTASRQFQHWLDEITGRGRTFVLAAGALEYHRSGWPHWHAMVKVGHQPMAGIRALYHPWYERHGYAKIVPIDGPASLPVGDYVAKYMCKQDGALVLDWRPKGLRFGAVATQALQAPWVQGVLRRSHTSLYAASDQRLSHNGQACTP